MGNAPQDTRDVAAAYWGQGAPKQTDIHGLGPPPRAVTIAMEEYVRARHRTGPLGWLVFGGLLVAIPPAAISSGSWLGPAVAVAVAIAVVVYVRRVVEQKRKQLRWFLEHANLHMATIQHVHARVYRQRNVVARAAVGDQGVYTLTLAVEGVPGPIKHVTRDTGLGNLIAAGQRIEVLLHPSKPSWVVTTAELPSS